MKRNKMNESFVLFLLLLCPTACQLAISYNNSNSMSLPPLTVCMALFAYVPCGHGAGRSCLRVSQQELNIIGFGPLTKMVERQTNEEHHRFLGSRCRNSRFFSRFCCVDLSILLTGRQPQRKAKTQASPSSATPRPPRSSRQSFSCNEKKMLLTLLPVRLLLLRVAESNQGAQDIRFEYSLSSSHGVYDGRLWHCGTTTKQCSEILHILGTYTCMVLVDFVR